ncbi:MAG: hypothetical protein [Bacteriophage sp.]|nr:MAG: hypothetical protein [Bacteriophage sp.]
MSCPEKEIRTIVMLSFKREELLYDAANYSYVEGDIMKAEVEHARHQVFDIVQDGNVDRVTRVLNLAHSECVEMLFPYTKNEVESDGCALNDILTEPESYDIILSLPKCFSMTTVRLLKDLIHEYLVCRVLEDWMSITNPSSQRNWEEKLESLKTKIKTSLVARRGKVRRKLKPF